MDVLVVFLVWYLAPILHSIWGRGELPDVAVAGFVLALVTHGEGAEVVADLSPRAGTERNGGRPVR